MPTRFLGRCLLIWGGLFFPALQAATPPLLAQAIELWITGGEDLAFTQHSRIFRDDGRVKEERIERYDPSLSDDRRWRLTEVNGRRATVAERVAWETRKNGKPRKKVVKAPGEYLDLEHATTLEETPTTVRYDVALKPESARLLAVDHIAVMITVEKAGGRVVRIAAMLRQPIRVLAGIARITGLDLDVRLEAGEHEARENLGAVRSGSTARIALSRLGTSMDYHWSDFKRVTTFAGGRKRVQ